MIYSRYFTCSQRRIITLVLILIWKYVKTQHNDAITIRYAKYVLVIPFTATMLHLEHIPLCNNPYFSDVGMHHVMYIFCRKHKKQLNWQPNIDAPVVYIAKLSSYSKNIATTIPIYHILARLHWFKHDIWMQNSVRQYITSFGWQKTRIPGGGVGHPCN